MCIGEHQRLCGSPTMVVSVVLGEVASCDGLLNVKHRVTTERGQNADLVRRRHGNGRWPIRCRSTGSACAGAIVIAACADGPMRLLQSRTRPSAAAAT
jgi:hypothetical protein